MMDQLIYYAALLLILLLIYVQLLGRGVAGSRWQIRCTLCGNSREARSAGMSLIGTLKLFSYAFDWCPGCAGIQIHKLERRERAD